MEPTNIDIKTLEAFDKPLLIKLIQNLQEETVFLRYLVDKYVPKQELISDEYNND